mmetsp:Transcript_38405/g.81404  ORF Transcript_38405/g.81404 Transcript_38405/m.81404 type:complete len:107 (-) Transcript_38405:829-1149(-)
MCWPGLRWSHPTYFGIFALYFCLMQGCKAARHGGWDGMHGRVLRNRKELLFHASPNDSSVMSKRGNNKKILTREALRCQLRLTPVGMPRCIQGGFERHASPRTRDA